MVLPYWQASQTSGFSSEQATASATGTVVCAIRVAGRERLYAALHLADGCGAERLAGRAEDELRASGARPRRRAVTGPGAMTASEGRVAHMAARGMTNREIAQSLFVTAKTVENQLGSAYRKLGVRSRDELGSTLASTQLT